MATYAKDTTVPVDGTLQEIRKSLKRYNAGNFTMQEADTHIIIAFEMCNRRVRFVLPLPQPDNEEYIEQHGNRYYQKGAFLQTKFDQDIKQKWRALSLCIKAKLESVDSGIETFEEAFLAQLVLQSGQTMGEWTKPQIERMFGNGAKMPPMLNSGSA